MLVSGSEGTHDNEEEDSAIGEHNLERKAISPIVSGCTRVTASETRTVRVRTFDCIRVEAFVNPPLRTPRKRIGGKGEGSKENRESSRR